MNETENQEDWLDGQSPADDWDAHATKRVLDELFSFARPYRSSKSYDGLLKFVASFRLYAPYNAMLVRAQMPGACYIAPAHRWHKQFGRTIKVDARPLVILQPMGRVMFVFDVSDTEAGEDSEPLPPEVTNPFEGRGGKIGNQLDWTVSGIETTLCIHRLVRRRARHSPSHPGEPGLLLRVPALVAGADAERQDRKGLGNDANI
jgi:hypothetical protein